MVLTKIIQRCKGSLSLLLGNLFSLSTDFNPYSAGIDFSRQNLTKVDPRIVIVIVIETAN